MLDRQHKPNTHMGHQDPMSKSCDLARAADDFDRVMQQGKYRHDGLVFWKMPKLEKEGVENVAKDRDAHNQ